VYICFFLSVFIKMSGLPKICLLIIYSSNTNYDKMLKVQQSYYKNFQAQITYYFIKFREQIDDIMINEETKFIYIKGQEGIMNILKKTLIAMEYVTKTHEFDFLIRTNISTVVDIYNLGDFLNRIPKTKYYGGGHILELKWGTNYSLFGTVYAQGTGIILSRDIVEDMCQNQDKLEYNIIDDVSIGRYIKKYHNDIFEATNKYSNQVAPHIGCKCHKITDDPDILKTVVFFRNRTMCKRGDDILEMQKKIKEILEKRKFF